jgi:hypothetical protein
VKSQHLPSRTVILALLCLCLAGCAVESGKVYVKDGKEYGVTPRQTWRARWWDYYARGSSYAAGEYWDEAMADFQAAMKQRHDDQRHARTYGMHRLDYFPHRELGIVYYRLRRYTEAIDELSTSLSSVDTAKAKFYLNKARRSFLQQTRRDTAAPRIAFTTPPDGLLTNHLSVTVTGYAEDDTYVSALVVNGQAQFVELAEPRLTFAQEVELHDGANSIDVVADDLVGQQARARLTVHLDRHGPLLSLEQVEVVGTPPQQHVHVQGLLADQSRITRFVLAGKMVPPQPDSVWEVREDLLLTGGEEFLAFEAEDAAGNITRGLIALRAPVDAPAGTRQGMRVRHPQLRWTSLRSDTIVQRQDEFDGFLPQRLVGEVLSTFPSGGLTRGGLSLSVCFLMDTIAKNTYHGRPNKPGLRPLPPAGGGWEGGTARTVFSPVSSPSWDSPSSPPPAGGR